MSYSKSNYEDSIPINGGFLRGAFGDIADLYEMDHGEPLPVGTPLPFQYLRRFASSASLGELEVLYLGLNHLLSSPEANLQQFSMALQEWTDEELRHLLVEIMQSIFPITQPQLDELLPLVTIVGGLSVSEWHEEELPKLNRWLPKILL